MAGFYEVLCFQTFVSTALYIMEINKDRQKRQAKAAGSELAELGLSLVTCVWQRLRGRQRGGWASSQWREGGSGCLMELGGCPKSGWGRVLGDCSGGTWVLLVLVLIWEHD